MQRFEIVSERLFDENGMIHSVLYHLKDNHSSHILATTVYEWQVEEIMRLLNELN